MSCNQVRIRLKLMKTRMGMKRSSLARQCLLKKGSFFRFSLPSQNSKLSRTTSASAGCQSTASAGSGSPSANSIAAMSLAQRMLTWPPQTRRVDTSVFKADIGSTNRTNQAAGERGPRRFNWWTLLTLQPFFDSPVRTSEAVALGCTEEINTESPSQVLSGGPGVLDCFLASPRPRCTQSNKPSASTCAKRSRKHRQRGSSNDRVSQDTRCPCSAGSMPWYAVRSRSMPPSYISTAGIWGKKSLPARQHIATKSAATRCTSHSGN
mmetsp:Transcript_112937/g.224826  ORF Transcript_112937/g.224826 Transcript_112937/m.224826 type:complete len:265 (-) Transcript_112937:946-1740(-)